MFGKLQVHIEKLNHFVEIAKSGSFRRAAEKMNLSQPTLSYSIKVLENVTHQKLFLRSIQGATLTPAGTVLFEFCNRYFAELETLENRMRNSTEKFTEPLRIGTSCDLSAHFWPEFLNLFCLKFPDIRLNFTTATSTNLKTMLIENKIDCAVAVEISEHPSLSSLVLFEDQYAFFVSPKSRFVWQTTGQVESHFSLASNVFPAIFVPDALTFDRTTVKQHLLEGGLQLHSGCYEFETFEPVRAFSLQGLGVAVLPKLHATSALQAKLLMQIQLTGFDFEGFGPHRTVASFRSENARNSQLPHLVSELQTHQWKKTD